MHTNKTHAIANKSSTWAHICTIRWRPLENQCSPVGRETAFCYFQQQQHSHRIFIPPCYEFNARNRPKWRWDVRFFSSSVFRHFFCFLSQCALTPNTRWLPLVCVRNGDYSSKEKLTYSILWFWWVWKPNENRQTDTRARAQEFSICQQKTLRVDWNCSHMRPFCLEFVFSLQCIVNCGNSLNRWCDECWLWIAIFFFIFIILFDCTRNKYLKLSCFSRRHWHYIQVEGFMQNMPSPSKRSFVYLWMQNLQETPQRIYGLLIANTSHVVFSYSKQHECMRALCK